MIPRSPISTLFPYTTLFRSVPVRPLQQDGDGGEGAEDVEQLLVRRVVGEEVAQVDLARSEEHTSELQSRLHLVCRLLLEKKNVQKRIDANKRMMKLC